jgi:hypothetical protein
MVKPQPAPQLSAFAKAMRKQYASSRGGTVSAERRNVNQSPDLKLFTQRERTGQPLKSTEWRDA